MKKFSLAGFALVLCLTGATWAQPTATNAYLVQATGSLPANLADLVTAAGGTLVRTIPEIGVAIATSDAAGFAGALAASPGVASVDHDLMVQWTPGDAALAAGRVDLPGELSHLPPPANDPTAAFFYPCQWNIRRIGAPGAWAQGVFGDPGVKVAVLDSGIDPFHNDLVGKVDLAESTSVLTPGTSVCNLLGLPDEETILDFRFHGTFVSSLITSNGLGIAGVAPSTEVVAVKVLNCTGSGTFGDVIAGIVYAANLPDVDVINMSLGATFSKAGGAGPLIGSLAKAVNYANGRGKLVAAASGNDGFDLQHSPSVTSVPAESGTTLSVYATGIDDSLASYSNFGVSATWVGAPGGDLPNPAAPLPGCVVSPSSQSLVLGACSEFQVSLPFSCGANSYVIGAGTSFASPLVAGVAALVDGEAGGALNGGQLKTLLGQTAEDLGAIGVDNLYSHGLVDASAAVSP